MSDALNEDVRAAFYELDKFITESSKEALLKLQLPTSFSSKSMSHDYDEGWRVGFRRCLVEFKRQMEKK